MCGAFDAHPILRLRNQCSPCLRSSSSPKREQEERSRHLTECGSSSKGGFAGIYFRVSCDPRVAQSALSLKLLRHGRAPVALSDSKHEDLDSLASSEHRTGSSERRGRTLWGTRQSSCSRLVSPLRFPRKISQVDLSREQVCSLWATSAFMAPMGAFSSFVAATHRSLIGAHCIALLYDAAFSHW